MHDTGFSSPGERIVYHRPSYRRYRSPGHRMHRGALAGWGIGFLVLLAAAVVVIGCIQMEWGTEHVVTMTVSQLDDQATGSGHHYLVFAGNVGTSHQPTVFEDTDAWLHGKSNSSDLWFALQTFMRSRRFPAKTLRCDVYGYRNHLWSSYEDVLWCRTVPGVGDGPGNVDLIRATGGV